MTDRAERRISIDELMVRENKARLELFERNQARVHERRVEELLRLEAYLAATRKNLEGNP